MNRSEFENSMKSKLQEQQFMPSEDMWLRLQSDLQKKKPAKKSLLFFAPLKMAAAILFVALGTLTAYLVNTNRSNISEPQSITGNQVKIASPDTAMHSKKEPETMVAATVNPNKTIRKKRSTIIATQSGKEKKIMDKTAPDIAMVQTIIPNNNPVPVKSNDHKNDTREKYQQPEQREHFYADNNSYVAKPVNVGLVANVGSSTVSNVNYQIGVMGRTDLSKTIFVEAGLTLASNTVSSSNRYSFPGVAMSSDGFQNSSEKSNTSVNANYGRNIISVGLTPAIGIKATKRLSFSTGAALNRNLNATLALTNEDEIESAALTNNIINTSQKVANWDIGLTCAAGYKVTKQLSFNVNYRKGLTNYLQQDNRQLKNSGVQLGLKFIFNAR